MISVAWLLVQDRAFRNCCLDFNANGTRERGGGVTMCVEVLGQNGLLMREVREEQAD